MSTKPMYSRNWFDAFASTVSTSTTAADVAGIASAFPLAEFPRLLEIGCGIGRIAGPLAAAGYRVVGIDVNAEALRVARERAPGPWYVALDQRHVGRSRWTFDGVLVLWNSIGFTDRADDAETLAGIANVLRPGGKAVLDLYHPDWLREHSSLGETDGGGATVHRWVKDGRCFHEIRYPDGSADDIQFNVYAPEEIRALLTSVGLQPLEEMTRWNPTVAPDRHTARYQLVCCRP